MLPDIDIRFLFGWYLAILVTTMIAMRGPPIAGVSELDFDPEKSKRSYSNRLFVNLNLVFVWPLILRDAIHDFIDAIERVVSIKPFVTGFWEHEEKHEYCVGPVKNPVQDKLQAKEIYVVVEEEIGILKQSLWPGLSEEGGEVQLDWNCDGYMTTDDGPQFLGKMERGKVKCVHRATYNLLLVTRTLSLLLFRSALLIFPYHLPTIRVFKREYEIFPVLTEDQIKEAQKKNMYTPEVYKPLRSDLLRGPEALVAARRAGFKHNLLDATAVSEMAV